MIAMADCHDCGVRMPCREAFDTDQMIASALADTYQPLEGPCPCGGTLREDPSSTLAVLMNFIDEDPE